MKSKTIRVALLFLFLFWPVALLAQTTLVSGTITDAGSVVWKNGTYTFSFTPSPGNPSANYFQNGVPFSKSTTVSGSLDSTGSLTSVAVPDNLTIVPSGSTWAVQVCPAATASNGCFKVQLTITGASQSITGSVIPPAVVVNVVQPGFYAAYTDGEIAGGRQGTAYFNLTDGLLHVCGLPVCTWLPVGNVAGVITATGSPVSGNLTKFSSGTSITNADLVGDVTTSGGVTATLASTIGGAKTWSNLATFSSGITGTGNIGSLTAPYANLTAFPTACGANQFATQINTTPGCTQPSFSNLSGSIASAQFGSQSANNFLIAPNGSSGNPTFRAAVGADIPAINLAATGNGGITGNLPVGNVASGSNGQCVITSGSTTVWGTCAGTAALITNFTPVTVNANVTTFQNLMSNTFGAGTLNATGKTIFAYTSGTWTVANLGSAVTVAFQESFGGANNSFNGTTTPTNGDSGNWSWQLYCTVTANGASGAGNCYGNLDITIGGTFGGGTNSRRFTFNLNPASPINWTNAQTLQFSIQFQTGSASNSATQSSMTIQTLN